MARPAASVSFRAMARVTNPLPQLVLDRLCATLRVLRQRAVRRGRRLPGVQPRRRDGREFELAYRPYQILTVQVR